MKLMKRREFLKKAPIAAVGIAGFPTIVKASALGLGGAVPPSDKIVMAGIGFGMQGPSNMRDFVANDDVQWVAVCDLDKEHLALAKKIVDEQVRQRGLRDLPRLPRALRPRRPRRGLDRRARPLARHPLDQRPAGRPRRLRREAPHPQPARRPGPVRRRPALRPRLADRAAGSAPWTTSTAPASSSATAAIGKILRVEVGLPSGPLRFRPDVRPVEDRAAPAGARLRLLGRPGALRPLLQGPRPHELALEHGLRRRPAHGLDRPSPRHRPLGPRLRLHRPGRGLGHAANSRRPASTTAPPATGSRRNTPTARRSSSPAATTRSRAARSGSASTAGSGWTGAASRPSRPTWSTRSSARTRSG